MYGAIIGDIIGSPYEGHRKARKNFTLFTNLSHHTDDSTMTVAVADATIRCIEEKMDDDAYRKQLIKSMQYYGKVHPFGYGSGFRKWLTTTNPLPYNSFGNGSAMRVSSIGWLFDNINDVEHYANISASVSHNHPDGIAGAQATAGVIFLARNGYTKDNIKTYVESRYAKNGYKLDFTLNKIRPNFSFDVSCKGTVLPAIECFLEADDFESTIRNAISLGGDADTLASIAGSVAEAYYGIPDDIRNEADKRIPMDFFEVIRRFKEMI